MTANLLTEVCPDVLIEPLTGEVLSHATSNTQDGARLDIAANGFWGGGHISTYEYSNLTRASSNRQSTLASTYRKHELSKKRMYKQRVREIEHSSSTSLVMSATGGLATEATFYKRLAARFAEKWEHSYSSTMAWL